MTNLPQYSEVREKLYSQKDSYSSRARSITNYCCAEWLEEKPAQPGSCVGRLTAVNEVHPQVVTLPDRNDRHAQLLQGGGMQSDHSDISRTATSTPKNCTANSETRACPVQTVQETRSSASVLWHEQPASRQLVPEGCTSSVAPLPAVGVFFSKTPLGYLHTHHMEPESPDDVRRLGIPG